MMRNADFGVLLERAMKYDKMISNDPASDRNEQMHVINAIVSAFPPSIAPQNRLATFKNS